MKKILSITMNPALDVSAEVDCVEPVRKLRCGPARREPGGGGINVARVVQRLSGDVSAFFPSGGYVGGLLNHLVAEEGLPCRTIPVAGETRENFTASEIRTQNQFRFVLTGPEMGIDETQMCLDVLGQELPSVGLVVASGSLPPGVPMAFYAVVAEMATSYGIPFVLDTSGPALARALGSNLGLIKPNLRELRELVGAELATEEEQVTACRNLVSVGKIGAIALTLGPNGGLFVNADGAWRARAPDVVAKSAVGAGDSFTGGMVWGMASGWSLERAFALGIAAGTAAVLTPGSELCRANDAWHLLKQITMERLPDVNSEL